jgi:hypothetical protein
MPYASVSDVRNLAPGVPITRESQPSEGTVATWIADTETALNASLVSLGYQIPLAAVAGKTTDAATTILKHMVAHAVMAMVMRARPNPEQDPENFQKRFDMSLKALRSSDDPFVLPDLVITGEATVKESPVKVSSNLRDLLDYPARITRDQVF